MCGVLRRTCRTLYLLHLGQVCFEIYVIVVTLSIERLPSYASFYCLYSRFLSALFSTAPKHGIRSIGGWPSSILCRSSPSRSLSTHRQNYRGFSSLPLGHHLLITEAYCIPGVIPKLPQNISRSGFPYHLDLDLCQLPRSLSGPSCLKRRRTISYVQDLL